MSRSGVVLRVSVTLPRRRCTTRRGQGRLDVVGPTIELMRHKAEVLGGHVDGNGRAIGYDVHGSIWPLDVYLKREVIEPKHHKAGLRYHRDRLAIYGAVAPNAAALWREVVSEHIGEEDPREEITEDERDHIEAYRARRLREATMLLKSCGTWWPVRLVVLDGIFVNGAAVAMLRCGLEQLARAWRISNDD